MRLMSFAKITAALLMSLAFVGCTQVSVLDADDQRDKSVQFHQKVDKKFNELLQTTEININDRSIIHNIYCHDAEHAETYELGECVLYLEFNDPKDFREIEKFYNSSPVIFDFLEKWSYGAQDGLTPKTCESKKYCGEIDTVKMSYRGLNYEFKLNEWEEVTNTL